MDTDLNSCSQAELAVRENFKKDYKLSCPVLDDNDCFQKSLEIWKASEDWEMYRKVMEKYDDFDDYRKRLRNQIVQRIEAVPGFDRLQTPKHNFPPVKGPRTYLEKENCGKRLLSVDLVKGNYQSLRYLGEKYVLGTKNYDEFIRLFTKEEAILKSKYFRQMVFGLLNPELQKSVQRMMMGHIVQTINKTGRKFDIVHFTSDEVVFVINNDADLLFIRETLRPLPYQFRVEEFRIHHIGNKYDEPWYVRYDCEPPKTRIMSVNVKYLFQVYNHVKSQPNQKKDFWWRERGRLCCLMEPEEFLG